MTESAVKRLFVGSERPVDAPPFDFSTTASLIITSCAPVKTEAAFWRKLTPNEPS